MQKRVVIDGSKSNPRKRVNPVIHKRIPIPLPGKHKPPPVPQRYLDSVIASQDGLNLPPREIYQDYIVLDPRFLYSNQVTHFPLYLYDDQSRQFTLFKEEDDPIQQEKLDELMKGGRRPVFISKKNAAQFTQFLSEGLTQIVDDRLLSVEEKTNRFSTLATSVMQSLFESPPDGEEFIATAKNVSDALAQLICTEPSSIAQLNGLRSYDYNTYSHSLNVCVLGIGLFQQIEFNAPHFRIQDLTRGLLLHDIGKCDIPHELTNKPGALSEEEWQIMRTHPRKGYERLESDRGLSPDAHQVALFHHEAVDGSGYPQGLTQDSIPFTSRLCKVVDVYDALTSNRSYKSRLSPFDSLQLMMGSMQKQIDMDILKRFMLFLHSMGKIQLSPERMKEKTV